MPCTLLFLGGSDQATNARCGVRRTPLRHLDPVVLGVGTRLLVFSPLPAGARRVRVDGADGSIRVEPARVATGFPGRFFVVDLPTDSPPTQVQAFADGGRAVVT